MLDRVAVIPFRNARAELLLVVAVLRRGSQAILEAARLEVHALWRDLARLLRVVETKLERVFPNRFGQFVHMRFYRESGFHICITAGNNGIGIFGVYLA